MQHRRFNPANVAALLSEERRQHLDPDRVLSLLPLATDQTVVDVGCGPGYFLIPLAQRLSDGLAVGIDVEPEMVAMARERVAEAGVKNALLLRAEPEDDSIMPTETFDGALVALVLHETETPASLLQAVARSLLPGGWCAVIEWRKEATGGGPPASVRLSPQETRTAAEEAGFVVEETHDLGERYYMMLLRPG